MPCKKKKRWWQKEGILVMWMLIFVTSNLEIVAIIITMIVCHFINLYWFLFLLYILKHAYMELQPVTFDRPWLFRFSVSNTHNLVNYNTANRQTIDAFIDLAMDLFLVLATDITCDECMTYGMPLLCNAWCTPIADCRLTGNDWGQLIKLTTETHFVGYPLMLNGECNWYKNCSIFNIVVVDSIAKNGLFLHWYVYELPASRFLLCQSTLFLPKYGRPFWKQRHISFKKSLGKIVYAILLLPAWHRSLLLHAIKNKPFYSDLMFGKY